MHAKQDSMQSFDTTVRTWNNSRGMLAIVEDDPHISNSLRMWSELLGLQSTVHTSAESLLNAICNQSLPLLGAVLDLTLPGMSGFELANRLRRMAPELPLVVITGMGEHERRRRGTLPAGVPCLTKPFDLDALDQAFSFPCH